MSVVEFVTPLNPLSLWVPLMLLAFVVVAAVWFIRLSRP